MSSSRINNPEYRKLYLPLNSTTDDLSGNGVSVTATDITYSDNAYGKTKASFDGSNSVIDCGTGFQDEEFTIVLKANVKLLSANWEVFAGNESYSAGKGWYLSTDSGNIRFQKGGGGGASYSFSVLDRETLIVGTYKDEVMSLYIDGVLVNATGLALVTDDSINLLIGSRHQNDGTGTNDLLDGALYDISYYNIALTGDEILELGNKSPINLQVVSVPLSVLPDKTDSSLIGSYLNACTRMSADDYSNQGNDGVSHGVTWCHDGGAEFNGVDSWIKIPDGSINVSEGTLGFVLDSSLPASTQFIFRSTDSASTALGIKIDTNSSELSISASCTNLVTIKSISAYQGKKTHVVISWSSSENNFKIFINGSLKDYGVYQPFQVQTGRVGFGSNAQVGNYLLGILKDANLYSEAKDQQWVANRYQQLFPEDDLVLSTLHTDARDSSGHGNDGVLIGSASVGDGFEGDGGTAYINYGTSSILNTGTNHTICFTYNQNSAETSQYTNLYNKTSGTTDRYVIGLKRISSDVYNLYSSTDNNEGAIGTFSISPNKTYRYMIVKDDEVAKHYLNGELIHSATLTNADYAGDGASLLLFNNVYGKGKDVLIYNTAKTSEFARKDYEKHKRGF